MSFYEPTPIGPTAAGSARPRDVRYVPDTDVRFWKRAAIALAIACAFLLLVLASGAAAKSERPKAAHQAGMIHYMIHA